MNTIEIKYFKGFGNKGLQLELGGQSLLVCGENGSGKSSFFEALKWIFFEHQYLSAIPASTREDQIKNEVAKIKSAFVNTKYKKLFEIKVDNDDYTNFNISTYDVFMIPGSCLVNEDTIEVSSLFSYVMSSKIDFDAFMKANREALVKKVNSTLGDDYRESIKIAISPTYPYICTLNDDTRGISTSTTLRNLFNEAKLRLTKLTIILSIISLIKSEKENKLIVFDDVLSSIDAANRSIFIKKLYSDFCPDYRIFFLTHNVSLFNLISYYDNNISLPEKKFKWKKYHFYESNGEPAGYEYPGPYTIANLRDQLNNDIAAGTSLDDVGNKIRKQFEILVHQIAQLLIIGSKNETHKIIKDILSQQYIYFKDKVLNTKDVIEGIEDIINNPSEPNKIPAIVNYLTKIKTEPKKINSWLSDLMLIQKVVLHPMSHKAEMVGYSQKELNIALDIMDLITSTIKEFTSIKDVSSIS